MVCVAHLGQVIDFGAIRLSETVYGDIDLQPQRTSSKRTTPELQTGATRRTRSFSRVRRLTLL